MEAYWDGWRPKEEGRWKRFQFSIFDAQNSPPTNNKTQSWENVHCHLHCSLVWTIEIFETLSLQHGFIPPSPPPSMTGLGSSQNQCTRHHRFSTSHQVFDASHFHPHSVSKIKDSRFYKWNPQVGLQNLLLSFSLGKSNRFHENSTRHCHSLFGNWTSPRSKSEKNDLYDWTKINNQWTLYVRGWWWWLLAGLPGVIGTCGDHHVWVLVGCPTRRSLFFGMHWSTCTCASVSVIIDMFLLIGIRYDLNLHKEITKRPACTDWGLPIKHHLCVFAKVMVKKMLTHHNDELWWRGKVRQEVAMFLRHQAF